MNSRRKFFSKIFGALGAALVGPTVARAVIPRKNGKSSLTAELNEAKIDYARALKRQGKRFSLMLVESDQAEVRTGQHGREVVLRGPKAVWEANFEVPFYEPTHEQVELYSKPAFTAIRERLYPGAAKIGSTGAGGTAPRCDCWFIPIDCNGSTLNCRLPRGHSGEHLFPSGPHKFLRQGDSISESGRFIL